MKPGTTRSRPARPAEEDVSSRDQLMNAAASLMSERQSLDFSLSEIAQRSGLNSALVKYYFGNKDGLLLALVERDAAQASRDMEHLIGLEMQATQKLRLHIAAIINNFHRHPYLSRLLHVLLDDRLEDTKSVREIARFFVKPVVRCQREILRQGIASGEFKPTDPMLLYVSLLGACDHLFNARSSLRAAFGVQEITEELRAEYIAHVTDTFIAGLRRR